MGAPRLEVLGKWTRHLGQVRHTRRGGFARPWRGCGESRSASLGFGQRWVDADCGEVGMGLKHGWSFDRMSRWVDHMLGRIDKALGEIHHIRWATTFALLVRSRGRS